MGLCELCLGSHHLFCLSSYFQRKAGLMVHQRKYGHTVSNTTISAKIKSVCKTILRIDYWFILYE